MRILVLGDSYMPSSVFAEAFAELENGHQIEYVDLDPGASFEPTTESELRIDEFLGNPSEVMCRLAGVEILVIHAAPVTEEVLTAAEQLKLICCARGGPINVDVQAAATLNLPVVTTPGKNAEAVADQTIAFLIMLARRFRRAERFMDAGGQLKSTFDGADFLGHDLGGHVLGLIGFGQVGRRVAARAVGFGMRILAYDPFVRADPVQHVEWTESLDELLAQADFVSLHARATPENVHFFDDVLFGQMKPGSLFVNTARESLVDEAALERALRSGRLAGAALDVFYPHAEAGPHPLLQHENVVMTPHLGGATHETRLRGAQMLSQEIGRFTNGGELVNVAGSVVEA